MTLHTPTRRPWLLRWLPPSRCRCGLRWPCPDRGRPDGAPLAGSATAMRWPAEMYTPWVGQAPLLTGAYRRWR